MSFIMEDSSMFSPALNTIWPQSAITNDWWRPTEMFGKLQVSVQHNLCRPITEKADYFQDSESQPSI
ncbi:hypothetical protein RRG08_005545 [Elysia crispata]|uniref:Uncharacterized protein n=1 Tax=Elysia crispata TaxID=231223 RepID=A0AAE1AKH0_9GAST|nr:hypothetical protein RRG08_005545 [Elysia crispata]